MINKTHIKDFKNKIHRKRYIIGSVVIATLTVAIITIGCINAKKVVAFRGNANIIVGNDEEKDTQNNKDNKSNEVKEVEVKVTNDKEKAEDDKTYNKAFDVPQTLIVGMPLTEGEGVTVANITKEELNNEKLEPVQEAKEESQKQQDRFVEFRENKEFIQVLQSYIFASLSIEWYFSGSNIIVNYEHFIENEDYFVIEDFNPDMFQNIDIGDITICAVDEVWNNGTEDYILRTRCYIDY